MDRNRTMKVPLAAPQASELAARFLRVRRQTLALCAGLGAEDLQIQSMPDASPGKWHLAHTSWFFEQFVLGCDAAYRAPHPTWHYLFNSYYQSVGPMHARPQRGLLSRPTLGEICDDRQCIDAAVSERLARGINPALAARIELGIQHEQQHQELLLTDLKHAFWSNPLRPAYMAVPPSAPAVGTVPLRYLPGREGLVEIGHAGTGFAFDNEMPRHRVWLHAHAMANRLVTNAEYLDFVRDGGYGEPALWLSDGWATVQHEGWRHPLYWQPDLASEFTLSGVRALDPRAPVCHLSYYEADAFARWAGVRLPSEAEWESAAADQPIHGNLQEQRCFHPCAASGGDGLQQLYGDTWEWTASPYVGYPGFRPLAGALGEYNGKFMCNQWVLRGGSCVTPRDHLRASYRNFFPPQARWQFAGIRLARDQSEHADENALMRSGL